MNINPQGNMILVEKIDKPDFITTSGIIAVSNELVYGKIVEFAQAFKDIYKKDDIVIFPSGAGVGENYNGKPCLWLNGNGASDGEIWGIVTNESK